MRRLLAIFTALALLAALPAVAEAKKGGVPPDHPDGLSCADFYESDSDVWIGYIENGDFAVTLGVEFRSACIDVTAPAGTWQIDIDRGSAREVGFSIKDSVPGDFCLGWTRTKESEFTLSAKELPSSYLNACGEEYSDDGSYDVDTGYESPLAFQAGYRGKRTLATPVTITVTLPPATLQ